MSDTADERLAQALAERARRGKRPPDLFAAPPGEVQKTLPEMLREATPTVYGALGGLAGTAPDQFEGSVLDPNTERVREGAKYGFPVGTALQVAPLAGATLARGASMPTQAGRGQRGTLFPYIKGPKGLPAFQTQQMDDLAAQAMDRLRSGFGASDVGRETGMWIIPRGGSRNKVSMLNPDNGAFMREIPDNDIQLRSKILTPTKKILRIGNLEDVLRGPTLFDTAPYLRGVPVKLDPTLSHTAELDVRSKGIAINPNKLTNLEQAKEVIMHEIEHVVQESDKVLKPRNTTMPSGGSIYDFDPIFSSNNLGIMGPERLEAVLTKLRGNPNPEAMRAVGFLQTLQKSLKDPYYGYEKLFGEQQAEAVAKSLNFSPEERLLVTPYDRYATHPFRDFSGINKKDLTPARRILKDAVGEYRYDELGDTDKMSELILKQLRKPDGPK